MSEVTINNLKAPKPSIKANEIPASSFFTGSIGSYRNKLFLKSYQEVVLVESPNTTWGHSVTVENYKPVDVEITIK